MVRSEKTTEQFLFPGYVFCRLNVWDRLPLLTVPGVVDLVRFGDRILPIPEYEIEQVRTMLRSGLLVTPWPFLEVGQSVLIEQGPLAGVEGILKAVELVGMISFQISNAPYQKLEISS